MTQYSIEELIEIGRNKLLKSGNQTSRSDTISIIGKVLKKTNLDLIINNEEKVKESQCIEIFNKIKQRYIGKPISKIFGKKEFYSREFFVNTSVLDPRPESELLVEVIKKKIIQFPKIDILELGVGSGCLIISLILELEKIKINGVGVDLCEKAIKVAKKNISNFGLNKKIKIYRSNWFSNVKEKFNIIISNPPYIKRMEIKKLSNDVKNFDPYLSLDGGNSGVESYKKIAKKAKDYLKPDAIIVLELGYDQLESVDNIFKENGFKRILLEKDLQGINRVVVYSIN
ncbi:MAG: peptide chain release factor N(5)-glutamine methyltransferase [Alphaproteobacteria bacterium]